MCKQDKLVIFSNRENVASLRVCFNSRYQDKFDNI